MPFAQLIIGSPGSGKSTYCNGMQQFMSAIGRKCSVVNLDAANEATSYPCALDIRDLIKLEDVMDEEELGPNGGILYALEELEGEPGWEWMEAGLLRLGGGFSEDADDLCPGPWEILYDASEYKIVLIFGWVLFLEDYVLFDCPGQVELFTHHGSLKNVFMRIQKMGYRVCYSLYPLLP